MSEGTLPVGTRTALRPVTPVGILAERLAGALETAELLDRVTGEHGIAGELLGELRAISALAGGLEPYVEACSTPESAALAALGERTRAADWSSPSEAAGVPLLEAEMLSGQVEAQFLKFLVAMSGATRVLEVGMFTGYSALAIAEALPADGRVVACEINAEAARFAQVSFDATAAGARIDVRVGPAAETLDRLAAANERFDLVFIDADKAGYLSYVDQILAGELLSDAGTIVVDNTLLQGEPWLESSESANGAAIAVFNAAIAADERVEQVLVPLRDGVTLIRRSR